MSATPAISRDEVTTILSRRKILLVAFIVAVIIGGMLWAQDAFWPFGPSYVRQPALAETPPLKPNTRTSVMTVPVTFALSAIRATVEYATPRSFTGKSENPMTMPFGKTDIGWTIGRGTIALEARPEGLTLSVPLTGTLNITGQKGSAGKSDPLANLERGIQDLVTGAFDRRGNVRGDAMLIARPTLLPNWRIDPKFTGHVTIPDGGLSIDGNTIDVSDDVKSAIDRTVTEQIDAMQTKLRNHAAIEQVLRREWMNRCRSVPLATVAADAPNWWLELRPIRAFASQPQIDSTTATLTLGVEAETRIVASATKPDCPFPAELEIVPPISEGHFAVATPIEVPFTEINRILNAQLKGRTFPEDADASAQITVLRARIAPSGDRLLVSLLVRAREKATWFGFGGRATVHILVRPVLDPVQQKIRFTEMVLDVQSKAAFGLLGAAARAAIPYFQKSLEQNAEIDLKQYLASARTGIDAIISEFDKLDDGIDVKAAVADVGLVGVEFDSKTLRVIAEAEGAAKIAVNKLPTPQ
jgi:uncharacterized protein DUF4403